MGEPARGELEHRGRGAGVEQERGGDLHQGAGANRSRQAVDRAVAEVPLRVGYDRAEAQLVEPLERREQRFRQRPRARLEQDPAAAAAERERGELVAPELRERGLGDLAATGHARPDASPLELAIERLDPCWKLLDRDAVVVADVRSRADQLDAVALGAGRHRDAVVQVCRAVVEPRQDVTVEVGGEQAPRFPDGDGQARIVAAMGDPSFYDHRPAAVETRTTHVSHVFLAGELVFKLKRAVVLPFAELGTREQRRRMCEEEVRLNRPLARDVYLGVRGVVEDGGGALRLGDADDPRAVEHVVEMRRLSEASSMAARLEHGALGAGEVRAVAARVAAFHAAAPPVEAATALAMLDESIDETFATLAAGAPGARGAATAGTLAREAAAGRRFATGWLRARRGELEARARGGRFRDVHGDLRAEHVFLDGEVRVIDCAELAPRLRRIDVGADLAFLAMDLERLGAPDLARELVDAYRDAGGDPGSDAYVTFHSAGRAWIRAKVALVRGDEAEAAALVRLARRLEWRARGPIAIVVCGPAASGKTTLATELARRAGVEPIGSDAVRKRLAGLAPAERGGAELYSPERSRETYAAMGAQARDSLERTRLALVDATFRRRVDRSAFREALGDVETVFVECRVPAAVADERATRREADADRVSDATAAVAREQRREWEPLREVEPNRRIVVGTELDPADVAGAVEDGLNGLLM